MRKGTMFISAALTAFILAMLAGVVSAYKGMNDLKPLSQPVPAKVQPVLLPASAPTQPVVVSPQDAAVVASNYLNRTDLFSAELADFNGAQTYKITFSSGDIVYVALSGQVLSAEPPPAPVVITSSSNPRGGGGGGNSFGEDGEGDDDD